MHKNGERSRDCPTQGTPTLEMHVRRERRQMRDLERSDLGDMISR